MDLKKNCIEKNSKMSSFPKQKSPQSEGIIMSGSRSIGLVSFHLGDACVFISWISNGLLGFGIKKKKLIDIGFCIRFFKGFGPGFSRT